MGRCGRHNVILVSGGLCDRCRKAREKYIGNSRILSGLAKIRLITEGIAGVDGLEEKHIGAFLDLVDELIPYYSDDSRMIQKEFEAAVQRNKRLGVDLPENKSGGNENPSTITTEAVEEKNNSGGK
jgi:hypothetical protein